MKLRGKEVYIITGIVAAVLIVAWYFLLFNPTQQQLSEVDQEVQSAQAALDVANQEVARLESYKKTAPQSRAEIVRLGKMMPQSEGIPGLIVELTKTAEASGVKLDDITPGLLQPGNPFGIQAITLKASGRYFDVEDFLYRVEEYVAFRNASFRATGRLLQVTSLKIAAGSTTTSGTTGTSTTTVPPLVVDLSINAYVWGGPVAAPAGGAP